MNMLRQLGSLAFVLGLFTAVFVGMPWYVMVAEGPVVPWWLRIAIFCLLGGILVVLLTLALEQWKDMPSEARPPLTESNSSVLLLNSVEIPGLLSQKPVARAENRPIDDSARCGLLSP